ncbi:F-box protein At4g00893-like [Apium graveolens]|uniref:F-box protein At4g00893-like n=1 Tax=Apium graveolens TaxID=4045 RepID=UPI003D794916
MDTIREVLWSELVADLLGDIIGRLCVADRVRFCAVCKSWRDAKPVISTVSTSTSMLAWFVSVGSTNQKPIRAIECRLFDPSYSVDKAVSVHTISFTELGIPVHSWSRIGTFCKQGWLFISVSEITGSSVSHVYFILLSPLTRKLKQLPSLTASRYFEQTFSNDPESADCVFLLLAKVSPESDSFTVTTCREGDTEWTVRKFERLEGFVYPRPIYTRGLFYIISCYGELASYDVNEEKVQYESLYRDGGFARRDSHTLYRLQSVHEKRRARVQLSVQWY